MTLSTSVCLYFFEWRAPSESSSPCVLIMAAAAVSLMCMQCRLVLSTAPTPGTDFMQGLSTELGAFVAGVMLSTTDQQENALHHLEQASTGAFARLCRLSTGSTVLLLVSVC